MNTKTNKKSTIEDSEIFKALSNYDLPAIQQYKVKTKKPNLNHIPGGSGLPLVGHAIAGIINLHKWINTQYAKHGNVFRFNIPVAPGVMILGPEANKLIFKNEGKLFSNHLAWEYAFRGLFENNILQRDFSDHKKLRKILQAAFKREAIEGHMAIMNPLLKEGISTWPTDSTIKAMDYAKELLLSTGANVFLGIEMGSKNADKLNKAFSDIVAGTADPLRRKEIWFSPYAKGVKGNKLLSEFIRNNIPERKVKPGRDLLSHFCHLEDDDGNKFSDEEIKDHILFVLFAAHDTTTSALSAILYSLASNLEWQETLRQEMLNLNKEELEFDDIDLLEKTDWTFKEALRMYPALTMMPRYALEDIEFEGHIIPANTPVVISALFTHYMPEYWSNPYKFDPERFSPERAEDKKDFYQYLPFGGGAHKCLGMHFAQVQGKMFLYHLLTNYKVTKDPSMTEYKYNNVPLTFPTDGLPLTFTKI